MSGLPPANGNAGSAQARLCPSKYSSSFKNLVKRVSVCQEKPLLSYLLLQPPQPPERTFSSLSTLNKPLTSEPHASVQAVPANLPSSQIPVLFITLKTFRCPASLCFSLERDSLSLFHPRSGRFSVGCSAPSPTLLYHPSHTGARVTRIRWFPSRYRESCRPKVERG